MSLTNNNTDGKQEKILDLVKRENNMLNYIKEHKSEIIKKIIRI